MHASDRRNGLLSNWEMAVRLLAAAALGSVIGLERERLSWTAGLRTHMLVSVGSALIMIVSAYAFSDVLGEQHVVLDPSRIAAQVVSGIGFLGAGAILLRGEVIRGLTTAASVWAVAAIGLAVGGGLYVAATVATVIILVILAGIKPLEERYRAARQARDFFLVAVPGQVSIESLSRAIGPGPFRIRQFILQPTQTGDLEEIRIRVVPIAARDVEDLIARMRALPGVRDVEERSV
jgi:putative Mg2+ transporter-C (MgtC) family protein